MVCLTSHVPVKPEVSTGNGERLPEVDRKSFQNLKWRQYSLFIIIHFDTDPTYSEGLAVDDTYFALLSHSGINKGDRLSGPFGSEVASRVKQVELV